ncbi:MAG: pitrilysin family protein [Azospirillaceae bacterium]
MFRPFTVIAILILFSTPVVASAAEVQRVVSPGGIEAWLVESHDVPVIAVSFAFRGGNSQDRDGLEGTANLLSLLLDEGAGELDSTAFQDQLNRYAIDLSFDDGRDEFYGQLYTTVEHADRAFELLHLALTEPRFDVDAIERMRAAVASDIRRQVGTPEWLAARAWSDMVFGDHPYGRSSRGTMESLYAISDEDLRAYMAATFARDNLVIGVAGAISAEALSDRLDAVFRELPAEADLRPVADITIDAGAATTLVRREGAQSTVWVSQPALTRDDPDYYPLYVVNHILGGGGFGSRLTDQIRAARGLTYGVSSSLITYEHGGALLASSDLSNANVQEALVVLRGIWRDMALDGPTEQELEDAVTYLTGSFPLSLTSTESIADLLVAMQVEDLGIDYLDRRNDEIRAVTLEDARAAAATYLRPDQLSVFIVGDPNRAELRPDTVLDAAALAAEELATN